MELPISPGRGDHRFQLSGTRCAELLVERAFTTTLRFHWPVPGQTLSAARNYFGFGSFLSGVCSRCPRRRPRTCDSNREDDGREHVTLRGLGCWEVPTSVAAVHGRLAGNGSGGGATFVARPHCEDCCKMKSGSWPRPRAANGPACETEDLPGPGNLIATGRDVTEKLPRRHDATPQPGDDIDP